MGVAAWQGMTGSESNPVVTENVAHSQNFGACGQSLLLSAMLMLGIDHVGCRGHGNAYL